MPSAPPDLERLGEIAARHRTVIVRPPLGDERRLAATSDKG